MDVHAELPDVSRRQSARAAFQLGSARAALRPGQELYIPWSGSEDGPNESDSASSTSDDSPGSEAGTSDDGDPPASAHQLGIARAPAQRSRGPAAHAPESPHGPEDSGIDATSAVDTVDGEDGISDVIPGGSSTHDVSNAAVDITDDCVHTPHRAHTKRKSPPSSSSSSSSPTKPTSPPRKRRRTTNAQHPNPASLASLTALPRARARARAAQHALHLAIHSALLPTPPPLHPTRVRLAAGPSNDAATELAHLRAALTAARRAEQRRSLVLGALCSVAGGLYFAYLGGAGARTVRP
ncbi:hypothetical protein LTR08_005064 [Meristemomyces frigidus]|nr:hypothetical protein LTR08_005064 [Meristemomyces frigidus]